MADVDDIRAAFDKFDRNGNGRITAAEYALVARELGDLTTSVAVAEAIIKQMDTNHDGELTFEEFLAARQG
ncbi:EF hand repeat-containing protein [Streptomyces sp. XY431]|uniref:EF-hand domain-containing protein n=1 Tax=Streptomyces sp. XY431 TaxID=1415562 RepID=UPI0006AE5EAA|nr:EF-hand domain-containing protein [Streptomyces sp. XY431]KOV26039.1 EF hand repeat-containing protein [Streptomyces sp. XY431]